MKLPISAGTALIPTLAAIHRTIPKAQSKDPVALWYRGFWREATVMSLTLTSSLTPMGVIWNGFHVDPAV